MTLTRFFFLLLLPSAAIPVIAGYATGSAWVFFLTCIVIGLFLGDVLYQTHEHFEEDDDV
jgi:hypothetical protein